MARPWGLAAIPLTYEPAASDRGAAFLRAAGQSPTRPTWCAAGCRKTPARQLPNLQKAPILVVHGEASFHAPYEHCTVKYLEQAGVHPTWIDLGKAGVHGNGHMIMLEKNSDQVAGLIAKWLAKTPSSKPARTAAKSAAAR